MARVISVFLPMWPVDRLRRQAGEAAPSPDAPLVLAAASLQEALTDAANTYARAGHPRPTLSFAASSALARQAEAGGRADLFVSIGTSGAVYPAAGYVQTAHYCGARTIELNLEPSQGSAYFDETRPGRAGEQPVRRARALAVPSCGRGL